MSKPNKLNKQSKKQKSPVRLVSVSDIQSTKSEPRSQEAEIADYIASMLEGLQKLAHSNGLNILHLVLLMALEQAREDSGYSR